MPEPNIYEIVYRNHSSDLTPQVGYTGFTADVELASSLSVIGWSAKGTFYNPAELKRKFDIIKDLDGGWVPGEKERGYTKGRE
jgi:hypothetical protein